jgi:Ca2+-binding EF-hand superfamily protein
MEYEKAEIQKVFDFVNRNETGYASGFELKALLLILGIKLNQESLVQYTEDLEAAKGSQVDFEGFWSWWLTFTHRHK